MSELTKKICLLGDFSVGKTSLVRRFVENRFDESYISTIGVRVSRKVITLPPPTGTRLTMLLWDTSGSEPFTNIVLNYYRGASGALLVCDLTRGDTLGSLHNYATVFHRVNPGVPLVCIGNKLDLLSLRLIADEQLAEAAQQHRASYVLTSARTGAGVEQAFQQLGIAMVSERKAV